MGLFDTRSAYVELPRLEVGHPLAVEAQVLTMMSHCLVFGRGDVVSCFDAVSSLAPVYRNSTIEYMDGMDEAHQWVVRLPGSAAAWTAIESAEGSAIYTAFPRNDSIEQMIRDADMPLERGIRRPWSHADVKPGEPFPAEFVRIFCGARARPAWEIPALAHLRPATVPSHVASNEYAAASPTGPAAGWYQDPQGWGYRWWDGTRWTEHVQR